MMTYEEFNKAMNECKAGDFDFAEEEMMILKNMNYNLFV